MQLSQGHEVERYVVEAMLGQGGMATVYRVRHTQLGTRHALKILSLPSASIRERLLQEGRVQATLHHPNIVAVTDVIDISGAPGLLMEYVAGPSLDQLLARRRFTREEADDVVSGVLAGVAAAHAAGLVHRDLKPANILLSTVRGRVVAKVADFGLAKILAEDGGVTQTRTGATMGTPAYMAPEQIRNARGVNARADVFALGAILYELACGNRAFEGNDTLDLFNAISRADYRDLRATDPSIPDRMIEAVAAALTVEIDQRPKDCEALWAIWSGSDSNLESVAIASGTSWSTEGMEELEGLSGQVTPLPDDSLAATGDWLAVDVPGSEKPGSTFNPATGVQNPAPSMVPAPPSSPSLEAEATSTARGAIFGVAATLLLMGGAYGVFQMSQRVPPVTAVPDPVPVVVPEPMPIPEIPTPVAIPAAPPVPQVAPVPVPRRKATAPEPIPDPAPQTVQPANGRVEVAGAKSVRLVSAGGESVDLTAVPPGKYTLMATFDEVEHKVGTVDVGAGEAVSYSCMPQLKRCNRN